ncbi:heterokaryon incompatibility protein-domain-containing protein [Cercophora newfieldiana]|uniref:Heterokaryon incompatibility protein-domain-containing protein n=1 Tax=Cercophora newfieldiana TaxID=92897 RepID=A0AA39XXX9_9PEZI|nr:heterokaryon incompatibility protein-domain-containing protein [Cercophora newfieldiana]
MSFPPYVYTKLVEPATEIRLVTLLPSDVHDDPVRVSIGHHSLVEPSAPASASQRPTLIQVRKTTPKGWTAHETLDGRFVFHNRDRAVATWTHPDPANSLQLCQEAEEPKAHAGPAYEALSYTWGSPADKAKDLVGVEDGSGCITGYLQVRANLDSALRHLRLPDRSRLLWIDAICINQEDLEDRSQQVCRMGSIFSLAQRVVVWFGPGSASSRLALSTLEDLGRKVVSTKEYYICPHPDEVPEMPCWSLTDMVPPYSEATWHALGELMSRPWFQRMWVVQEVQLGSRGSIVQCGRDSIQWQPFRYAIACLRSKQHFTPISAFIGYPLTVCLDLAGFPFDYLLSKTKSSKCSDDRDRIYGILSLTPAWFQKQVVPNYTAELVEVYKTTFLVHAGHTKGLGLLPFAKGCNLGPPTPGWSSWVPDYRFQWVFLDALRTGTTFYASSITKAEIAKLSTTRIQMPGAIVDTVTRLRPVKHITSASALRQFLESMGPLDSLRALPYPTGGNLLDAACATLAVGRLKDWVIRGSFPTLSDWREKILSENPKTDRYLHKVLACLKEADFFETKSGYIGMCAELLSYTDSQTGDEVVVFLGSDVPMILRKQNASSNCVVGYGYLHGFMNGEALLGRLDAPWRAYARFYAGVPGADFLREHPDGTVVERAWEDPRLAGIPLPSPWESVSCTAQTKNGPRYYFKFKDTLTGEMSDSDPRLSPESLRSRGVPIEYFCLE